MNITKQKGYPTTATERMESARTVKQQAITREMCWVSVATRIWPSYVMEPRVQQVNYPLVAVIQSPAGTMMYRVRTDELPLFEHLAKRPNAGEPHQDKTAILLALAVHGWQ